MSAAIVAKDLSKAYSRPGHLRELFRALWRGASAAPTGRLALEDVSFALEPGTSLGVIGRNGSGKTTLLRILAGALQPTRGFAQVRGRVATLLDLGAGIDPGFTGRENALLLGRLSGANRRELIPRLHAIRDFSGLGAAFDDPVREYSAGMVLRLAFSSAIHAEPDVLLVDEVLAVGDAFFQQRCLRRIRELQAAGCTIVLVTHDLSAIFSFCDRGIWLEHGRVACEGDPAKVVREYMGAFYRDSVLLDDEVVPRDGLPVPVGEPVEPALGVPAIDHRYGDGRAVIEGVALRDGRGGPLATPMAGEPLRVVITARCRAPIQSPIVGFTLRSRLGEVISATNTAYEERRLPSLEPGDRISVEFALRWPPFASGSFSISPAIADGSLDRHEMNDWIDNAVVTEASSPATRYGWLRLEDVDLRWSVEEDRPA